MASLSLGARADEDARRTLRLSQRLVGLWFIVVQAPAHLVVIAVLVLLPTVLLAAYILLHLIAPKPRLVFPSEKTFRTSTPSGQLSPPLPLPSWYDRWLAEALLRAQLRGSSDQQMDPASKCSADSTEGAAHALGVSDFDEIEPPELLVSVVIPAYNEELRIVPALEEAIAYLDARFGRPRHAPGLEPPIASSGVGDRLPRRQSHRAAKDIKPEPRGGYEILVVDDGSTDATSKVTLAFANRHGLHDSLRYIRLERNRGKGGAVIHGLRHVRGAYILFADADGATRFSDLGRLMEACEDIADAPGRGIAIGSRAHLIGSEAVVKRSALRNLLMRGFHLVLTILTPPATSRIRDTQCGFKLFTRSSLPHVVPYMHAEGWIFDIEMLMLAESAPAVPVLARDGNVIGASPGIRVAEVPVAWREVPGSKLNVVDASLRMAFGLAVLRASWMLGVYRRRVA